MTLKFSHNRFRMIGIRKVQYSVTFGWSKAICVYAYFFSFAIVYGKPHNTAYGE